MRILHLIQSTDIVHGGPIEGIVRQGEALRRLGVEQEIACLDHPAAAHPLCRGFSIHHLGDDGRRARLAARLPWLRTYGYSRRLEPWLRMHAGDYDAVVMNGLWTWSSRVAARVLRGGRVPYLIFTHGALGRWFRDAYPAKHLLKRLLWRRYDGPLAAGAAAVLYTTEDERHMSEGTFPGHPFRSRVVGYGTADAPPATAAQADAFRAAFPALAERRFLLFLGRIHPMKGCDLLIRALAAQPDHDLHLAMAGPDSLGWRTDLERLAAELGVAGRVHWLGMVTGEAKWGALRRAEALALPSHQENFGIAVVEALACGRPVLISDQVAVWREIAPFGCALVAPDTATGAADLLCRWHATPTDDRRRMAETARACFEARFDLDRFAAGFRALLEEIR